MAQLSEQEREDLVAYLDGELDEEAARQLEAKLTLDPEARAEADALQQAWGLLDYLPRPELSPSFTHRTLERLAVRTSALRKPGMSRWLAGLGWAAAVLIAIAAGFGAATLIWPARQGEDPEFLRALEQPELFGEDSEAHEEPPVRATHAMARYSEWLDHLDPDQRDKIRSAADTQSRLQVVRDLREQEWLARQPKKRRDEVAALKNDERSKLIDELRKKERRRRQDWQIATRFWEDVLAEKNLPSTLEEMQPEVQVYANEYLRPHLSREDQERLDKAKGWPKLPQTLVELAERHPVALGGPWGPRHVVDLPHEVQDKLKFVSIKKFGKKEVPIPPAIKAVQGRWPLFADAVVKHAAQRQLIFPNELWPYKRECLSPDAQEFVKNKLEPVLTDKEKRHLARQEGTWPDYPQTLDDLARSHGLEVPWLILPGAPRKVWEKYKIKKAG